MNFELLGWYVAIFMCLLLLLSGNLMERAGRNLGFKLMKKGIFLSLFGICCLTIMSAFGPPPKTEIKKETPTIVIDSQPRYVNSIHEKIIEDVYNAQFNHGNRPTKDHVAHKGNWILRENKIKILVKLRTGAMQ